MTAALIMLGALALFALLVLVGIALTCESTEAEIVRQQEEAEAVIDQDHQAARRAMNDAAGQSWRNISE